jgi:hypothetical protein|eukprot:SAG25_NODE_410_length_8423_cov_2.086617_2_plen_72_part_00
MCPPHTRGWLAVPTQAFHQYDRNRDGVLDRQEFKALLDGFGMECGRPRVSTLRPGSCVLTHPRAACALPHS